MERQNYGPGATVATVSDTLPASVTFISATPSRGSCSEAGGVVSCNLGNRVSSETVTVAIDVTPNVAGIISNTASVSGSQGADPDPTNAPNSDTELTQVDPAPCTITGTSGADNLVGTATDDVICGRAATTRSRATTVTTC